MDTQIDNKLLPQEHLSTHRLPLACLCVRYPLALKVKNKGSPMDTSYLEIAETAETRSTVRRVLKNLSASELNLSL
jgi:hypothetical protein